MMKFLVPVDFTQASDGAIDYAISLAKSFHATVHLLHVFPEPLPGGNFTDTSDSMDERQTEYNARIKSKVKFFKSKYGQVAITGSTTGGFKTDSIVETANAWKPDLIVLGVKRDRKKSLFQNRTAPKLIRKSRFPLLLVPEQASFVSMKNIVLAVDFAKLVASSSFKLLLCLAEHFRASVTVLHINYANEKSSSGYQEKLQEALASSDFGLCFENMEYTNVNSGILDFINRNKVELLAMTAYPHNLVSRLMNPPHTDAISFEVPVPLLILKSNGNILSLSAVES